MLGRCVRKTAAGAGLALLLGLVRALPAATLHVDSACPTPVAPFDSWATAATNVADALAAAGEGDVVLVTNGTYVVSAPLTVPVALALVSVNGPEATRIHAVSNRCLLATAPATIDGFAFTNGYVNAAPVHGAGVHAPATGVVVRNCRFENNYAGANGQGGGLWIGPSGTVENCMFSRNRADVGGGLFASNGLALAGCTFTGNWTSTGSGGGVFATGDAGVTHCGFFSNQAGGGTSSQGGGAFCSWTTNAAIWIRNCRFEGNASKAHGGAVSIRRGGTVEDSVFLDNTATNWGGAAHLDDTNCRIRRCELRQNACLGGGGAIYGRSQVAACLIVSNRAASGGGLYGMNTMQVEETVVRDNLAGSGGGLYGSGAVAVRNGLFVGNVATNRGGGVYAASRCLLENCTLAANVATSAAGFYGSATAITVLNSIVHANLGPNVSNRYASIVFSHTCTEPAIDGDSNLTNDPAFLLPTAGNFRLGTGSLCRDAGTNQPWMAAGADLAGNPRLAAGTVDLGAYETGPLAVDGDAAPRLGVAPLDVVLTAAAAGTNVEGLAFRWDFQDDGAFDADGACVTNAFPGGIWSIRLEASNAAGEVAAAVKTNWIAAQGGVAADFTADVRTGAAPFAVRFTDLSANDPQFWVWDFDGDGVVDSTEQHPEWTYASTGFFTVALAVSNDFGGGNASADAAVKTNYVHVPVHHLVADFAVAPTQALTYETLQFTDVSSNGPTHWTWYFRNVGGGDSFEQNPTSHYTAAGYKTVKLVVSNEWSTAVAIKTNLVRIAGHTPVHYVAADGGNVAPFTNWASAARTLEAALDVAEVLDTVWVSNGTYGVPFLGLSCVGMTLRSVNGPEATVLTGADSERILRASSVREEPTFIAGFTLTNAATSGDGAGLWITHNVVVSNCVVAGCRADGDGGGILLSSGGLVTHCDILGNVAGGSGGGIKIATTGAVVHCRIAGNVASNGGGGIHAYSTHSSDSIRIGHCRILGNRAPGIENGGGVYLWHARIHDSLIVSNSAYAGGGVYGNIGAITHCTLAENAATNGGGLYVSGCDIRNAVVWGNSRSNLFRSGAGNVVEHCVVAPATAGDGNLADDPLFRAPAAGDYRLRYSSPALDAAAASEFAFDLDGRTRPLDGTFDGAAAPDAGAFEYDPETADSNGDGIPDWWYHAYALDPLDAGIAAAHSDADGYDNRAEWTALTDPVNAASHFALQYASHSPARLVGFDSRTNRLYLLQRCTQLTENAWSGTLDEPERPGIDGADFFAVPEVPSPAAFRIRVRLP